MQQQAQSHSKPQQSEVVNVMTLAFLYSIFGANFKLCVPNATKGYKILASVF